MPSMTDVIKIWFFVSPEDGGIDAVFMQGILGLYLRDQADWEYTTREDSAIDELFGKDDVYQLDWDAESTPGDEELPYDWDSYEDTNPTALKMYDKGELDLSELEKYADKIYDHKDFASASDILTEQ